MILTTLVLNAIAFYVVSYLVPGVTIAGWQALLVVSVVWGVLSILVKPILILLTLPINILTLGLFTFVINALLIMLMSNLVRGFHVTGFGTALIAEIEIFFDHCLVAIWITKKGNDLLGSGSEDWFRNMTEAGRVFCKGITEADVVES